MEKTSSIVIDFVFDRDFNPMVLHGDHPQVQEIIELIEVRMVSEDMVIDDTLFPEPEDFLDHAWETCVGALQHHFPKVEFVRMGVDQTLYYGEVMP